MASGRQRLGSIAVGVVLGVIFVVRQRRLSEPLVDLSLFRARAFNGALGANCVSAFVAIGIELFTAQYLQLVLGMGPFQAGLWSVPSAAGIIVGSMIAPRLYQSRHAGADRPCGPGARRGRAACADARRAQFRAAAIVAGTTLIGLGVGPVGTLATDLIVGAAPPDAAGAASAISETGTELGGALGIAILGSVGAAVYRGDFGTQLLSAGTPSQARETLAGAVQRQQPTPRWARRSDTGHRPHRVRARLPRRVTDRRRPRVRDGRAHHRLARPRTPPNPRSDMPTRSATGRWTDPVADGRLVYAIERLRPAPRVSIICLELRASARLRLGGFRAQGLVLPAGSAALSKLLLTRPLRNRRSLPSAAAIDGPLATSGVACAALSGRGSAE